MLNVYIRIPALTIEILAFCKELHSLHQSCVFNVVFMESAIDIIMNIYPAIFSSHKIETTWNVVFIY